jgi:hypothetical protein
MKICLLREWRARIAHVLALPRGYKCKLDAVMITNPYYNASTYTLVLRYCNENLEHLITLRYLHESVIRITLGLGM